MIMLDILWILWLFWEIRAPQTSLVERTGSPCRGWNRSKLVWWMFHSHKFPTPQRKISEPEIMGRRRRRRELYKGKNGTRRRESLLWLFMKVPTMATSSLSTGQVTWLMLQTTTDGKKTSERGTVIVSTVVTTVAFMKSAMDEIRDQGGLYWVDLDWWLFSRQITYSVAVEEDGGTAHGHTDNHRPEDVLESWNTIIIQIFSSGFLCKITSFCWCSVSCTMFSYSSWTILVDLCNEALWRSPQQKCRVASEWPLIGQASLGSNPHPSFTRPTAATLSRHGQIRGGQWDTEWDREGKLMTVC